MVIVRSVTLTDVETDAIAVVTKDGADVEAEVVEVDVAATGIPEVFHSTSSLFVPSINVSLMIYSDHVKQADQSWGAPTGKAEWNDEKAGADIAKAEEKEEGAAGGWDSSAGPPLADESTADGAAPGKAADASNEPAQEPEPEDNSRSYAEYLAEQTEKKLKLGGGVPEARKPNEGSKQNKEWQKAKPMTRDEENAEYMAGKGEKAKRERQRKEKNTLDVDLRYVEPSSARGGSERGGRGRGRGDRGDFRGRGRGRGEGFRGRGDGASRGGRGGRGGNVNVADENAFPSLGGS